jgi:dihydroorotase
VSAVIAFEGVAPYGAAPTTIVVRDGVIAGIGAKADVPAGAQRVDAKGLIALPGLVDLHTHLREPGREDAETIETGSRSAARGGFTLFMRWRTPLRLRTPLGW